jgi:acyl-CoA reductase-like NAD-dependent aldehyde dehydrogenase
MKSSEVTPLSTLKFGELVKEAGFPAVSSDTQKIIDTRIVY